MISESDIRKKAGNVAFQKGMGLFLHNKVTKYDVENVKNYEYIRATVEGSYDNEYEVDIQIDPEKEKLVTAYCECPAYDKGITDICKHCAAVLLKYNQQKVKKEISDNNMLSEFMMMRSAVNKNQERKKAEVEAERRRKQREIEAAKPKTNGAFLELMQKNSMRKVLPLVNGQVYGKVHLEPHIILIGFNISIRRLGVFRLAVRAWKPYFFLRVRFILLLEITLKENTESAVLRPRGNYPLPVLMMESD